MKIEIFAWPGYVHVPRLKTRSCRLQGSSALCFHLRNTYIYQHVLPLMKTHVSTTCFFFCCSLFQKLDSLLSCAVAEPQGVVPSVVVGVVGIGHVDGITDNWEKDIDVKELLR